MIPVLADISLVKPAISLVVFSLCFVRLAAAVEGEIEIRGVLVTNGTTRISAEIPGTVGAKWIGVGEAIGPWMFREVDFPGGRFGFVDERGEKRYVLLSESEIKDARDAWIRSTANPMFYAAARLPMGTVGRWSSLSSEERARILDYYRKHGWIMEVLSVEEFRTRFHMSAIHEEERRAERRREGEAFRATLSESQAAAYDAMRRSPLINFKTLDPAHPPRDFQQEFLETLSPDRRKAWEESINKWSQGPEFALPLGLLVLERAGCAPSLPFDSCNLSGLCRRASGGSFSG